MNKLNGFTIAFGFIIAVFTIGFFVFANDASFAFGTNYEQELFTSKINSIEQIAVVYAENTEGIFTSEEDAYIKVDDLAKLGYIINNEGLVSDPRDETKTLNDCKIRLSKEKDKITAKVLA